MAAAQAQATKLGDDRLTIEHMVLALADNPRWVTAVLRMIQIRCKTTLTAMIQITCVLMRTAA